MKFYIACIQKLSELVQEHMDKTQQRFMICPSLRVFEASDFEFLTSSQPHEKSSLLHEDISMQLNSMSTHETLWDIDANKNLFEYYKEHLKTLKVKDQITVSDEIGSGLGLLYKEDGAPTEELVKYSEMLETYTELLDLKDQYKKEIATTELKDIGLKKLENLNRKIMLHMVNWKQNGNKKSIEEALEKENKLSDYDTFLELKSKAESELLNSELTGMQSLSSFTKLQIIPANFYKDKTEWNSLEIEDTEVDTIFENAKKSKNGFNEDLFDFEYEDSFIKKINVDYCLINIRRTWLKKSLIDSEFIVRKESKKTAWYPKKVLLIKDIKVILHDNLDVKEKKAIEAESLLKFGPLFMKNQFFTNLHSKESFIKPITNKKVYKNLAMNIDKQLVFDKPKIMVSHHKLKPHRPLINRKQALTMKLASVSHKKKRTKTTKVKSERIVPGAKPILKPMNAVSTNFILPSLMVHSFNWVDTSKQARLHIKVKDKILKTGIYKVEVLIKSTKDNYFKDVETNHQGVISFQLPKGNYRIELRKNGYKEISFAIVVQENKNIELKKTLEPKEVVYDSFFLGGIIGEQITI